VIRDLRASPSGETLTADICLIGAGAAGITIARELSGTRHRVCLIEGGGLQYEYADSQQLYQGDSIGIPVALTAGRLRFFGGSTNHWGGRCAELQDIDFRRRQWVPNSGWPIVRADLEPYYARARRVAGFSESWLSDSETLSLLDRSVPSINRDWLRPFLWHYTPATENAPAWGWADAYGTLLANSANVLTLLHANFVRFATNESRDRVRAVIVKALNGVSATISANTFVLCSGGIENARLLLLAAEQNGGGFASENGLVGRYFMQHPRGPAGLIVSSGYLTRIQEQLNKFRRTDGIQIEVGLALSPQVQQNERLLNCSGVLQYEGDPQSGVTAAQEIWRSLLDGRWAPDMGEKVGEITKNIGQVIDKLRYRLSTGESLALEGAAGIPARSATILLDLEQAPEPDSRVSLGPDRDALGLRQVVVNWRWGEQVRRTAMRFTTLLGAEFARLGIGRCRLEPWLLDERIPTSSALQETFHHMGTTRMADDAGEGVVDRNCAVHGMGNLYVAGSSVFPTAGQANPTLTIVALAIRLADRLRI